ncbi:TniB family NTP-binding protein [Fusibacter bizertensis]
MSTLTDIKRRIIELEGGAFQELCDALLSRSGYEGIHAFGMQSGTMKTTIGNPDTYFKNSVGKYIFVAYTTQKERLYYKAKEDIEKCLDVSKTGVETKDIAEIIFCHTSSNLSAGNDKKLSDICASHGILLNIYGIDRLADEIYRFHKILSKDHLGLSIDTNQIMDYKTFVERYDANEMATPLSTIFQFRENEYNDMITSLNNSKVIAVVGQAGVGKSRISLEVAKNYGLENGYRILCIRSTDLPISEDIASYIERPGKYLLFIDDANELIGLKSVLEYLNFLQNGYDVKIIATMRDYTAESVIAQIKEYTTPHIYRINRFTDDEIKTFLDVNMEIRNSDYVDKIINIAEGNARIAYMTGRLAKLTQNLEAIKDATDLYESYYGKILSNSPIIVEKDLCLSASIIALLHTINLGELSCLEAILEKIDISIDEFKINVYRLFELEFVDIKLDKVAIVSDQCLGNYMLLYCFFKKKYILFSDILEVGFRNFRTGIIKATSVLWNIFSSEEVHSYLESEIKKVWDLFENESEQIFCEYVKVFHDFRPLDALLFVKGKIDQVDNQVVDITEIDFTKNEYKEKDTIMELLAVYRYHENLETAIELICEYVNKKQDVVKDAYDCIENYYSINQYSVRNNYYVEKKLINTLRRKRESEILTILFIAVAEQFLQTVFRPVEYSRGNKMVMYNIPLVLTEGSKEFRKGIWEELFKIADSKKWQLHILKVLQKYAQGWQEHDEDIISYDQSYIVSIILKLDSCSEIIKGELINQLERKWKHYGIKTKECINDIYDSDIWNVYHMFSERYFDSDLDYEEAKKIWQEKITSFAEGINTSKIEELVKQLNALIEELDNKRYEFISSIDIFVSAILSNRCKLETFVDALISYGSSIDIHPGQIITELIVLWGEKSTYNFISERQFQYSNLWKFVFFESLLQEKINKEWTERLIAFLNEDSDKSITTSSYRNLIFLEKYLSIDSEIFCRCAKIILEKKQYSIFIVKIYFDLFFNKHCCSPDQLYKYFEGDKDILKEIYFFLADNDSHMDYDGTFIKYFISVDTSWLHSYAVYFYEHQNEHIGYNQERITSCWKLDNFYEIFDYLFDYIAEREKNFYWKMKNPFVNILIHKQGEDDIVKRQHEWVTHTIRNNYDSEKIFLLFEILSELGEELRVEAIKTFVSLNKSFDIFSKLRLEPNHWGGSGSMVPYMQARVKYYESLLPFFTGLDFLQHKKLIQDNIEVWKRRIEKEEIDEIMEERFL